jgi:hypothetical protein
MSEGFIEGFTAIFTAFPWWLHLIAFFIAVVQVYLYLRMSEPLIPQMPPYLTVDGTDGGDDDE